MNTMHNLLYILDDAGNPVPVADVLDWGRWWATHDRHVGDDTIAGVRVSTIFGGVNRAILGSAPRGLYETWFFTPDEERGEVRSYDCREIAQAGHQLAMRALKQHVDAGLPITREALATALRDEQTYENQRQAVRQILLASGTAPELAEIKAECILNGYLDMRDLGDAGIVAIAPLAYTHAILAGINLTGHEDRWCYHTYEAAKAALDAWDGTGEPTGWHRHPDTGRRVDDEGNMYVQP